MQKALLDASDSLGSWKRKLEGHSLACRALKRFGLKVALESGSVFQLTVMADLIECSFHSYNRLN